MKSIFSMIAAIALVSCNETVSIKSAEADSLRMEADSLAGKIGQKVEQGWDTAKLKAKGLKEKIEDRLDSDRRKDTTVIKIDQ